MPSTLISLKIPTIGQPTTPTLRPANMLDIKKAFVNASEHRIDDFKHHTLDHHRWQLSLLVEDTEHPWGDPEMDTTWCHLHFTTYGNVDTPEKAYRFFIKGMKTLDKAYQKDFLNEGGELDYRAPYYAPEYRDFGVSSEGFKDFITDIYPVDTIGPFWETLKVLDHALYVYYSSVKLLSYGFGDQNVGKAFENLTDFKHFLDNPPTLSDNSQVPTKEIW